MAEADTAATESGTEETASAEETTEAKDSAGNEGTETAAAAEGVIPRQQSAEEAADREAGEGART
ncbi:MULTISPECIES: gliding motility protein [unclassified Streptomyces]|uniref:gliding motility protein n=1 Tax=Streptomyces sp. NBRC 14336 TaxID=3030992 RepID=UPI00332FE327